MALQISKKTLVIAAVVVFAVLLGTGGYIAWRISQPEDVTPDEAEATNNCCDDDSWSGGPCSTDEEWDAGYTACQNEECNACVGGATCSSQGESCDADAICCDQTPTLTCQNGSCQPAGPPPPPSGCTIGTGCNCCCDSYSGCGSGCRFEGANPGLGQISMCTGACAGEGYTTEYKNLSDVSVCADCANSCVNGPSCDGDDEKVYEGMDPACGGQDHDYTKEYKPVCGLCGNPIGCIVCCKRPSGDDDPICGDGILGNTPDEHCELGDPAGSECPWSSGPENERCDHDTCICPKLTPEQVQLQGRVYCQEEATGELFPIEGADITFAKITSGGPIGPVSLATNSDGYFRSEQEAVPLSYDSFFVKLEGLPADGRLSNDWPYSQMGDPFLENESMCPGICNTCSSYYDDCNSSSLTEGSITSGFRWVYRTCSEEPPNPDWDIDKTGSVVCYEEGTESVYAEVTYIITITNTQDGGILEYVRDEYEDQIQQSWIISTQPTASQITSEYIQWDIPVNEQMFEEGESREFRYTARIPRALFGEELENHAIGHLGTDEELHAYEDIFVTCGLPITGIFDSTAARIALGGALLVFGFVYYRFGIIDGPVMWLGQGLSKARSWLQFETGADGLRKRWETRMIKKVNKRRRKSGKK